MNRIADLIDETDGALTNYNDKITRLKALYTRYVYENMEKRSLVEETLQIYQCN